MFAKVEYAGFYTQGSNVQLNHVKIMQSEWHPYEKPLVILGKKTRMNPRSLQMYYAVCDRNIAFFAAWEYGCGHYRIFAANDSTAEKLLKNIDLTPYPALAEEKQLFDTLDGMIGPYSKAMKAYRKAIKKAEGEYERLFNQFLGIHEYVCGLEAQGKIITDSDVSIGYMKEMIDHDGPEYALVIGFRSKSFPGRKYRIGVCVRGDPFIKPV